MRREVEIAFAAWPVLRMVYAMNISKGGMRLELGDVPKIGDPLTVNLKPPRGPAIRLAAIVRNVTPIDAQKCSVGVEFPQLDAAKRAEIENLLAAHAGGV